MKRHMEAMKARRGTDDAAILFTVQIVSIVIFGCLFGIVSATLLGVNLTANSKNAAQAFNSAEGGRSDLLVAFTTEAPCEPTGEVNEDGMAYTWRIYNFRQNSLTAPTVPTRATEAGVQAGCPMPIDTHVLIEVTGVSKKASKTITATYAMEGGAFDGRMLSHVE